MRTTLYLLRHAATEANLANPPRLQGRRQDPPLARLGVRQAEATRDLLAVRSIDCCFTSPLKRAMETAAIVAAPFGLNPMPVPALTECDIGRWEGMDWQEIRFFEAAEYRAFMSDPASNGYPGGENFTQVHERAVSVIEDILDHCQGKNILIVSHHVVNRIYLSGLLGLPLEQARQVSLNNCGISVVSRADGQTTVSMLNAAFHLQGVAA